MVEYNIAKNAINDLGENYLDGTLGNNDGELGYSTYFTQINDTTMYTINGNTGSINVYNLRSLLFEDLGTTIPIDVDYYGCIASSETPSPKLYISGGNNASNMESTAMNNLQILSLDDMQWMDSTPSMIHSRHRHGCIVVNDRLWAIGGLYDNSVEAINITDIPNETWWEIGHFNYTTLYLFGITAVDELIFIVGGMVKENDSTKYRIDTTHTINTVTNEISVYPATLPMIREGMPVVAVNRTIYGFGCCSTVGAKLVTLDMLCTFP